MPRSPEQKRATILVVDDSAQVVNAAVTILKAAYSVVFSADSGLDALQIATGYTGTIDLLLCDVKMPGMSGPVLAALLRETRPDMQLVFMSGGYDCADSFPPHDGWSYVQKPFNALTLVTRIDHLLSISASSRADHRSKAFGYSDAVPENEDKCRISSTISAG